MQAPDQEPALDSSPASRTTARGAAQMRRLLCATDLTPRSDNAVRRTALLAQRMNARAIFVHAVGEVPSGREGRMKVNRAYVRLALESERAMSHAPENSTIAVRPGKPLEVITVAAREHDPDVIVMAPPKRRRIDVITGTTTERVIRGTQHSVLLAGRPAERAYQRVVLATDLSPASEHVARTVASMGLLEHAYAWVVHAFHLPYDDIVTSDRLADEERRVHRRAWKEVVTRDVLRTLASAGVDLSRVQVHAELGNPMQAIEHAMERLDPELLVIGVSRWFMLKRILLGSVAHEVFRRVKCDVLAISAPARTRTWLRAA